jgi:hypothetical protein
MKKMQEKSKIYNIQDKTPTPPQTKSYGWQIPIFQLKRAAIKTQGFSMTKNNTPPETKVNYKLPLNPRQIRSSAKLNKRRRLPMK